MKKRDFLKNIGLSSLGLAVVSQDALAGEMLDGPKPKPKAAAAPTTTPKYNYGRTKDEMARDAKLLAEKFYTDHEMKTITVLSDIIIPADKFSGSASQAGVPAFIEFITKDKPEFKTPMRGGLRWLDSTAIKRFGKDFVACTAKEQINIVDDIAYPEQAKKEFSQGVNFFTLMRNLTASGFYSSEMGHKDMDYQGNRPNNWEGVPDDVLKQYGLSYS
ncbi:gluconate 2-dehydrogenase subunit 3-like protein [Arcicella aurantiaca]|uniref:Gluconate 2-dehydrogenase subunit 3-like protein n=1 Tax=Arcicella aurantiaca TaxID=591202 RepID=A0A316E448_9BACT|nr:gluconate 2-dehydrogenase subunit 3 family protein [Arcicella aurantiaca]PWK24428.1 gluconate 2-dehydrogenase subunit 3-like protein [Arcicella aurantiaca]